MARTSKGSSAVERAISVLQLTRSMLLSDINSLKRHCEEVDDIVKRING